MKFIRDQFLLTWVQILSEEEKPGNSICRKDEFATMFHVAKAAIQLITQQRAAENKEGHY